MKIIYLGHAGFCVETARAIVVIDPWLSPEGAFDHAWFQFPRNHHLAPFVQDVLRKSSKELFVYVSHEHRDHFDPAFLSTLPHADLTFVVPHFERPALRSAIAAFRPKRVISCCHGEAVEIPGGEVRLYLEDSGLNRDSAVLIKADGQSFLNLNDCKLYDQLSAIRRDQGPISVFTCQFSGATWHPTCYNYSLQEYERISQQKLVSKFEVVARAIENTRPRFYIPSAGPPCFLDPALMHLNFEPVNIFPRATKLLDYLRHRPMHHSFDTLDMMPGATFDVDSAQSTSGCERVTEEGLSTYLSSYAAQYQELFGKLKASHVNVSLHTVVDRLRIELESKLSTFILHERVRVPLYFWLSDSPAALLRIDFPNRIVEPVREIRDSDYYSIEAPSWQIARILDGCITWEEFALTFRMRLNRRPDVYQTLIQGFLLMEAEDMNWFCANLLNMEQGKERVVVGAAGTRYSIDRQCPHGGADLSQGWSEWSGPERCWICPRHRWQFALDKGGQSLTSNASIHAVCLEND